MKRLIVRILMLVLLVVATPLAVRAQYTVQQGDTLWSLAGDFKGDSIKWGEILGANPFLKEAGRQFVKPDGTIVVLIRPGETLKGLNELGVKLTPVPISELKPAEGEAQKSVPSPGTGTSWWPWIFGAIILCVLVVWWADSTDKANRRRDPITSGPAIVEGGVQPNETERLERTMNTGALNEYTRINPGVVRDTVRAERIGPIERGMVSGEGMVGYADRARRRIIDPPQPGYRARFRFPDGSECQLMSLQGCMNPCYYGEGMSGFTFTPAEEVVPAPTSQPAPVVVVPTTQSAPAEHATEDGLVRIELRRATAEQPAMIRMTGIDEAADTTAEIRPGSVVVRFTPRQK